MTKPFQLKPFESKLPHTVISVFSKMTQLAHQHGAVNLSQGFPDFEVDTRLIALVSEAMHTGHNQYAPTFGVAALREAITAKYQHSYGIAVDPDTEVTITAGGTQGLFTAIGTLIEKGDEVIIFEPAYDSYQPSVEAYGGRIVPIRLLAPDFSIDWDYVRSQISARTKLIIINNPNNPTGRLLSTGDINALESIVQEYGLFVLSDEVYEHLVYDDRKHISVLSSAILRERSYVAASFGKVLHTTGWKMGYIIGNAFLTAEFRKIHQFNVFSVNTPMQHAVAKYLEDVGYYDSLSVLFEAKRNVLKKALEPTSFQILPCEGTYFMLLDYSAISSSSEMDFAVELIQKVKVATVPVSAFYSNGLEQSLLRVCFAKKEETLNAAALSFLKI